MYDNIATKIKGLSATIFIVEVIAAIISGALLIETNASLGVLGVVIMIAGSVLAWATSLILYGFGEIISLLCSIEKNTRKETQSTLDPDRINKLNELRQKNLITEEEYQQAISKSGD